MDTDSSTIHPPVTEIYLEEYAAIEEGKAFTDYWQSTDNTSILPDYLYYMNIEVLQTILSVCHTHNNPNVMLGGTIVECVFLVIVLYMMYFFSIKAKFKPSSNIWLFVGSLIIVFWICTKITQDYADFQYKCLVTENSVLFCSLFGSSLNVGMCVDRCKTVYSHMAKGGMTLKEIILYICLAALVCCVVIVCNTIEMLSSEITNLNTFVPGCFQSASSQAQEAKLILKVIINGIFISVVLASTTLTIKKVMSTNLKKKKAICVNIVLVTFPVTFIWIMSSCYIIWEIKRGIFCPKSPTGNIFIYLTSLPMLVMLLIYLFTGENLKRMLSTETHTVSLTSVFCCCASALDFKRLSETLNITSSHSKASI
nr:homolog of EHV2 E6 membrane protein BILF1 [Macronycteris gammaherpesvirus 1]BEG23082.1 homolog of EHV2 E6 membrane protein BILF1 [Macronycteris gammaherpesvirus 1]